MLRPIAAARYSRIDAATNCISAVLSEAIGIAPSAHRFLGEPRDHPFRSAVELRRNTLRQRRYLSNAHAHAPEDGAVASTATHDRGSPSAPSPALDHHVTALALWGLGLSTPNRSRRGSRHIAKAIRPCAAKPPLALSAGLKKSPGPIRNHRVVTSNTGARMGYF